MVVVVRDVWMVARSITMITMITMMMMMMRILVVMVVGGGNAPVCVVHLC